MAQSDWIEDVRSRANLVEIVQGYTTLTSRGRTWRGPCPLHQGTDPNFSVNPARGTYQCYVCDEHGDVFTFVMKVEGLQFLEAAKRLAAMVGVAVPERAPRRRSPEAIKRGQDQTELASNGDLWAGLGLRDVAASGGGGAATDGTLTIPYGPSDAPDGWVHYEINAPETGGPIRRGAGGPGILWAPGARLHVHERPLVLVSEPIAAWRLAARSIPSVAVARTPEMASLITSDQMQQIARSGVRKLVIAFFPARDDVSGWRTLFATESVVLASGVEPLWNRPAPGVVSEWAWAGDAELDAHLRSPELTRPLFAWRVAQITKAQKLKRLPIASLSAKLSTSLDAVAASGDRIRFQAYLAWAARELGVQTRNSLIAKSDATEAVEF